MGWLITAGILFLIAAIPLGVRISFDEDGLLIHAYVSLVKIQLYPLKKKKKTDNSKKPKEKKESKPSRGDSTGKSAEKKKGGKLQDFLPLIKLGIQFLGDFKNKLRINDLYLKLIMAGDDPCDLAVNYGRAWAALANIQMTLERAFTIRKRNVEVECDFQGTQITVMAVLDISVSVGRLLLLVLVYAVKALTVFLKIRKTKKGSDNNESKTAQHAGGNDSEDQGNG